MFGCIKPIKLTLLEAASISVVTVFNGCFPISGRGFSVASRHAHSIWKQSPAHFTNISILYHSNLSGWLITCFSVVGQTHILHYHITQTVYWIVYNHSGTLKSVFGPERAFAMYAYKTCCKHSDYHRCIVITVYSLDFNTDGHCTDQNKVIIVWKQLNATYEDSSNYIVTPIGGIKQALKWYFTPQCSHLSGYKRSYISFNTKQYILQNARKNNHWHL